MSLLVHQEKVPDLLQDIGLKAPTHTARDAYGGLLLRARYHYFSSKANEMAVLTS